MSATDAVERLVERDVFRTDGADELQVADPFRETVEAHRATLSDHDSADRPEAVGDLLGDPETASALAAAEVSDPDFLARYVALRERDDDLSATQASTLAVVLGQFETGRPRDESAPEAFLSVDGEDLLRLVALHDRCVVYAWREDCPPCETIKADFDELFADGPPGDVLPLAVYGPDCPQLLDREFDVSVAPTLLFTLHGDVDSRYVGAPTTEGLRAEIQTLRERTLPSAE
ncbi:thioredoxin family protein [Haloplanus salilacus]|uniref:thioredoxin family protein n=1 Tax=Haloplanus salilacus TaxID=2949994 RepID=UPI0030D04396